LSEFELNIRLLGQSYNIEICLGSSCFSRGNREVVQIIRDYLRKNHLDDKVVLRGARCMNRCSEGPFIIINGKTFSGIGTQDIEKILEKELT
jgi:NADH:ubiquinone oxidoreductase subunit E